MSREASGLIIFSLDSLIAPGESGKYHDWQLLPDRDAALRALAEVGWVIGVVSNQDAIADGLATSGDYLYKIEQLERLLGIPLDSRVCYYKPNAALPEYGNSDGCLRRLPCGEMLVELMLAHPDEARRGVLLVGSDDDRPAAEATGIDFMLAAEFFILLNILSLSVKEDRADNLYTTASLGIDEETYS